MHAGPHRPLLACSPVAQAVGCPAEKEENRRANARLRSPARRQGHELVKFWRLPGWRLRRADSLRQRNVCARDSPAVSSGRALPALAVLGTAAGGRATAWEGHTPLPDPRSEVAAATAGGDIVVVGGFIADGNNSSRVDAYSIADDRWRRLPDLPVSVDHASAASTGGRIYVTGGYGADRKPLRSAFVLDGGAWRRLPLMPDGRAAAAAAIAAGHLYVVGGRNGRRLLAKDAFALKLGSARWARIPGPTPREHLAAAASRNRIYAVGGRAAGLDSNTTAFEVVRRRCPALARARAAAGSARRHGRGGDRRAHRLGRRGGAGRHDQDRLRL